MKSNRTLSAGIVAGVSLAVAAFAYAQPFAGIDPRFGGGMGMGPGHGPMAGVDPTTVIDSRLSDLKAQLKITTTQEAAWQAFTAQRSSRLRACKRCAPACATVQQQHRNGWAKARS